MGDSQVESVCPFTTSLTIDSAHPGDTQRMLRSNSVHSSAAEKEPLIGMPQLSLQH